MIRNVIESNFFDIKIDITPNGIELNKFGKTKTYNWNDILENELIHIKETNSYELILTLNDLRSIKIHDNYKWKYFNIIKKLANNITFTDEIITFNTIDDFKKGIFCLDRDIQSSLEIVDPIHKKFGHTKEKKIYLSKVVYFFALLFCFLMCCVFISKVLAYDYQNFSIKTFPYFSTLASLASVYGFGFYFYNLRYILKPIIILDENGVLFHKTNLSLFNISNKYHTFFIKWSNIKELIILKKLLRISVLYIELKTKETIPLSFGFLNISGKKFIREMIKFHEIREISTVKSFEEYLDK